MARRNYSEEFKLDAVSGCVSVGSDTAALRTPPELLRVKDALVADGIDPSQEDIRLQGSSAQFSSDAMVDKARQTWEAMDPTTREPELIHPKYHFVQKKVAEEALPELYVWEERLGREVAPALFGSVGPPDKTGVGSGVSTHFPDSDWIINRRGGTRR